MRNRISLQSLDMSNELLQYIYNICEQLNGFEHNYSIKTITKNLDFYENYNWKNGAAKVSCHYRTYRILYNQNFLYQIFNINLLSAMDTYIPSEKCYIVDINENYQCLHIINRYIYICILGNQKSLCAFLY